MKPQRYRWRGLVRWAVVLACAVAFSRLEAVTQSPTITINIGGGRVATATVNYYYKSPSPNFPTFAGEVTKTISWTYSGPVDGNTYNFTVDGVTVGLGMPYDDPGPPPVHYSLPNTWKSIGNPTPANGPPNITSISYSGPGNTGSISLFGSQVINGKQDNVLGVTVNGNVRIPNAFLTGTGNITLKVFQNGQVVQTITKTTSDGMGTITNEMFASGNIGNLSLIPNAPVSIALSAIGYKNDPSGGGIVPGNSSTSANVFLPITNGSGSGLTLNFNDGDYPRLVLTPDVVNSLPKFNVSSGNGTPQTEGQPLWVNPITNNASYTLGNDTFSNAYYMQGVANQMGQQSQFQSTNLPIWQNMNAKLGDIANNTANISVGGGGGNLSLDLSSVVNAIGGANSTLQETKTITTAMSANIASLAANFSTFLSSNSGVTPEFVNATVNTNQSAAQTAFTSAINQMGIPDNVPDVTEASEDATDVFQITLPSRFGGQVIDFNPFRNDRFGPILSAFRSALAWLAVAYFAIWALKRIFEIYRAAASMTQITAPKILILGNSDGGATLAAIWILLFIAATVTLLLALVAAWDTNFQGFGLASQVLTSRPFSEFPARVYWFIDHVFPVVTIVSVILARIVFFKFVAVAYWVYVAFNKVRPG